MTEYMVLLHRSEEPVVHTAEFAAARTRTTRSSSTAPTTTGRSAAAHRSRPAVRARSLRPDGRGGLAVTDGPYSETAEQVGGYYLVSAPSLDALTAAVGPLVLNGEHVEIRPTDRESYQ